MEVIIEFQYLDILLFDFQLCVTLPPFFWILMLLLNNCLKIRSTKVRRNLFTNYLWFLDKVFFFFTWKGPVKSLHINVFIWGQVAIHKLCHKIGKILDTKSLSCWNLTVNSKKILHWILLFYWDITDRFLLK